MSNLLAPAGGPITITKLIARDIRFPTSDNLDGSDAMNKAPDYSAAYAIIETDHGPTGHGFTFTIGRGNEVCVAAIKALAPLIEGLTLEELMTDLGAMWRRLTGDSHLRWLGPDKGVMHLATAAVVNALWDLYAKLHQKPVWHVVADMSAQDMIDLIDWRYIQDALDPGEARERLEDKIAGRPQRIEALKADGYPAYTTSAGWLGYSDEKLTNLVREALAEGWTHFKMKVGGDPGDDARRAALIRQEIGPDLPLMMDANQVWGASEAIDKMKPLAAFNPLWIEEPTSPDDILGHARIARAVKPIGVATGEHCQNIVMFKQLLQAQAISFCQIDSGRLAGPNEIIGVMLLADHFGVPVCPHAGGVGLCELVQHMSMIDYVCISGTREGRLLEFVDHLHEHFVHPVVMNKGRYMPPLEPGYSSEMKPDSLKQYAFPGGSVWRGKKRKSKSSKHAGANDGTT